MKLQRLPAYQDYAKTAVTAEVLSNPVSQFDQTVVIAAGRSSGIRVYDAVVTDRGLVGQVTKVLDDTALVTLLTDKESAVTAKDHQTSAVGIVRHSQGPEDLLFLDRVLKNKRVNQGDLVITAGQMSGHRLSSFYPRNIPIGRVTSVGQTDVDPFQDVQVMPFVDFSSLQYVLVLASKQAASADAVIAPRRESSRPLLLRDDRPGDDRLRDRDPRRLARPRARHARRGRAHAGLDLRRGHRLLGRPAARHCAARHARLHVAPAHARRLLDRPLRRDDGTRPLARAAPVRRRS